MRIYGNGLTRQTNGFAAFRYHNNTIFFNDEVGGGCWVLLDWHPAAREDYPSVEAAIEAINARAAKLAEA